MIPLVDNIGHIAFVDDPSFVGKLASDRHRNLVVVAVWTAAFAVVVQNSVAGTHPNRAVAADMNRPLASL